MKKLLAILLAGLMVFTMVACGDKNKQGNNDDDQYKDTTVIVDSVTIGSDTFRFENVDSETVIVSGFSTTNDKAHAVTIPAYLMVPGNEREQEPDQYLRVVGVGKLAFKTTSSIKTLNFPTEAAYLEHDANFDISKHSFTIAEYAFRDCVALESLTVPAYVTEIGVGAFINCTSLKNVNFEAGSKLTEIQASAFMSCVSLQSITVPASVKEIGEGAFFECKSMTSVVINEGTLVIGDQAFQKCAALESVQLPASLGIYKDSDYINSKYEEDQRPAPIGEAAFGLCDALTEAGWGYAGVAPVKPEKPDEGVAEDSAEYKAYEEALAVYEDAFEAYTAIMNYKKAMGFKSAS